MKNVIMQAIVLLTCGCATYTSKKDCSKENLEKLAQKLAYKGQKKSLFTSLQKSCKKHGIEINKSTFIKGWTRGMKEFCTEQRGFHWGLTRRENPSICIKELKPFFNKGYLKGKRAYQGKTRRRKS